MRCLWSTCAKSPFGARCANDAQCETQSCAGGTCAVHACTQPSDCPAGLVCVPVVVDDPQLDAGTVPARGCLLPVGAPCAALGESSSFDGSSSSCVAGISGLQSDLTCPGFGFAQVPVCSGHRCACSQPGRPCVTDADLLHGDLRSSLEHLFAADLLPLALNAETSAPLRLPPIRSSRA
jgi:hypothetical protein